MKRFHILIPDEEFDWLSQLSDATKTSVSDLIRDAIADRKRDFEYAAEISFEEEDPVDPSKAEDSKTGVQKRLRLLEQFVYRVVVREFGMPSAALLQVPHHAPDYLLRKPND